MTKKLAAEFFGTFWLVFGGCGSAVLAAAFPHVGIGSARRGPRLRPDGADHGLCRRPYFGRPFQPGGVGRPWDRRPLSWGSSCRPMSSPRSPAQSLAHSCSISSPPGRPIFDRRRRLRLRTAMASIRRAAIRSLPPSSAEVVLTAFFLLIILGATGRPRAGRLCADRHRPCADADPPDLDPGHQHVGQSGALAPGRALFVGGWALQQLWLFWLAPLAGAIVGGIVHKSLLADD